MSFTWKLSTAWWLEGKAVAEVLAADLVTRLLAEQKPILHNVSLPVIMWLIQRAHSWKYPKQTPFLQELYLASVPGCTWRITGFIWLPQEQEANSLVDEKNFLPVPPRLPFPSTETNLIPEDSPYFLRKFLYLTSKFQALPGSEDPWVKRKGCPASYVWGLFDLTSPSAYSPVRMKIGLLTFQKDGDA